MTLTSHASRWIIAGILIPVIVWTLFFAPPAAFYVLAVLVGLGAWWEYHGACLGPGRPLLLVLGLCGWLAVAAGTVLAGSEGQRSALFVAAAWGGLYFLIAFRKNQAVVDRMGRYVLGQVYISYFFSFVICLFVLDQGRSWVFFSLVATFLGDTSAFYAGRTFGKRRLYPEVSPNKTWEGLAGGVVGSGLAAGVSSVFLLPVPWYEAAGLGLFLGLWGAFGDLIESMFKRSIGIKDSGRILMAHGGIWDRIDALLFNLPVIYFFAISRGG